MCDCKQISIGTTIPERLRVTYQAEPWLATRAGLLCYQTADSRLQPALQGVADEKNMGLEKEEREEGADVHRHASVAQEQKQYVHFDQQN